MRADLWKTILALCLLIPVLVVGALIMGHFQNQVSYAERVVDHYIAVFHPASGSPIELTSTIILRIPTGESSPENDLHFTKFHNWLTDNYGGWSRWKVESQADKAAEVTTKWVYMIGIADATHTGAGNVIAGYVEAQFGRPYLIIEMPANNRAFPIKEMTQPS